MTFQRVPVFESPEFQGMTREPGDGSLIWLLQPWVLLHALFTQPLATRRTYAVSRALQFRPLESDQAEALPASVLPYLTSVDHAGERLGFHGVARYFKVVQSEEVRNTSAISLGLGPTNHDFYVAGASEVPGRFKLTGLTLFTAMTDGSRIVTDNEWRLAPSSRLSHHHAVTFDQRLEFGDLYEIHRRRVLLATRHGRVPLRVDLQPSGIHPFELLQRWSDEHIDDAIRRGYVDPSSQDLVRLTLKGAFAVSLKSISQLAPIFDWRARRHASRVMRTLT